MRCMQPYTDFLAKNFKCNYSNKSRRVELWEAPIFCWLFSCKPWTLAKFSTGRPSNAYLLAWFSYIISFFAAFEFRFAVPSVDERLNKLVPDEESYWHKYTRYSYHFEEIAKVHTKTSLKSYQSFLMTKRFTARAFALLGYRWSKERGVSYGVCIGETSCFMVHGFVSCLLV